mgnify:CR=1 FL=1|jgi:dGTPase|tara:strand:+ start:145822 stop:146964 length:1143 start_codon:yes stop_codon:yes gene_type:complete
MPLLAPYAADPAFSRGRQYATDPSNLRDAFERDRDRIVHAASFRRLKHKTQVFVAPDGDHFRTRLTHSLEVAQIGRVLARALNLHEGLTEAICLAHDLGHPPFGHVGEEALDAAMQSFGGFDHNAHTLRVLCVLESAYADHDGLNLSWEVLEGLAKHNGPVTAPTWALAQIDAACPLDLGTRAGLEAQIAALADDIAYDNHDFEDGLRAGLFSLEAALQVSFIAANWRTVEQRHPRAPQDRLIAEMKRRQIGLMVEDVLRQTQHNLADYGEAGHADVIRAAPEQTAAFSPEMAAAEREMKAFLYANMYRHPASIGPRTEAADTMTRLFTEISANPARLPESWERTLPKAQPERARHIADFIAGMTDRYALRFGEELQMFR